MKKNIVFFCSWLDINAPASFFYEQAEILICEYNPILVVFKEQKKSFKALLSKFFGITSEGNRALKIPILEIQIPKYSFLPKILNEKIANQAVRYLQSELKKSNELPSLIHAHSVFDAGIWAYKYHFHYKTPYLITEHSQISFLGVDKRKFYFFRQAMQKAKYRLVVSNDKIRQFAANNLFFDFINVGNLISPSFSYKDNPKKDNAIKITTIGAFSKLKDQETILIALNNIDNNTKRPIKWTWIGSNTWGTDHGNRVKKLLCQYPTKNINIEVKPILNREEVLEELQSSDLFVLSSLTEGMPVSVLEALACGVPVFSTYCGGVEEVINDSNGKLFQIKDAKTLSEYLMNFILNPPNYNRKEISNNILKKYGSVVFREKMLMYYNNILNDSGN